MKRNSVFRALASRTDKKEFSMAKNDVAALGGEEVEIMCIDGGLYVTWRNGREACLESGQGLRVASGGKICIWATMPSRVAVEQSQRVFFPLFAFFRKSPLFS